MGLKQHFDREYLKTKIGEENIFVHYFGDWNYGASYSSVFRKDEKNSTGFYQSKTGSIIYNDLRTGDKYDFVHFVMKKYGINYYEALRQIAVDFGLVDGTLTGNQIAVVKAVVPQKQKYLKTFIINACKFRPEHLAYWAQYGITESELKANRIFAIDKYTVNKFDDKRNLVSSFDSPHNNDLKFVYTYTKEDKVYVKIYTPHSKDYKWFGDVPINLPFGLDDLTFANNTLIITKSVKDCLVLRKFFTDVIGLQNEGESSLDEELLFNLTKLYKNVYVWFDCDRPGIKAANYYKKNYGLKPVFVSNGKKNIWQNLKAAKEKHIKDPSDFVKQYGLDVFKQYLQYIKLI